MKPKKRQKLCYHCEGEVDLDVIVCPFCAADLREEKPEVRANIANIEGKVFGEEPSPLDEKVKNLDTDHPWIPIAFFTAGIQLLLFGLFTLLFSHQGLVLLSWDATYWFIYCLIGGPLLYFGYKKLY